MKIKRRYATRAINRGFPGPWKAGLNSGRRYASKAIGKPTNSKLHQYRLTAVYASVFRFRPRYNLFGRLSRLTIG